MRVLFTLPPRHRNPLMQALSLLLGLLVIGAVLVFGLVVGAILLVGGAVWMAVRSWRNSRVGRSVSGRAREPQVLEGDYTVIRSSRHAHHH